MSLELRRHENILYPMPYMETEVHPFIVTNQRLVQTFESGQRRELPTREVEAVARGQARPLFPIGLALILIGFPLFGYGGFLYWHVRDMKAAPILSLFQEPAEPAEGAEEVAPPEPIELPPDTTLDPEARAAQELEAAQHGPNWPSEVLRTRLTGQGLLGGGGFLMLAGWRLLKRRRFFVLCQGGGMVMKVRAVSENQQTQILMTVQAVLT